MAAHPSSLCPSAQPDWAGAQAFAVIGGSEAAPQAAYLTQPEPVTDALLAMAGPVGPTEVFRFAAPCATRGCQHFDAQGSSCRLVSKTIQMAPVVVQVLPRCGIRRDCRWWQEGGAAACQRCPQVVTLDFTPSPVARMAADPSVHG
jgi:hypothetical protein